MEYKLDKFCTLTDNGFNIDTTGRVGHCCIQKREVRVDWDSVENLNEWYKTNDWLNAVRNDLNQGIENSACEGCWHNEKNNRQSKRHRVNQQYGETSRSIRHLDLRLSNKCNLQCKMCSGGFSDQIVNLAYELKEAGIDNDLLNYIPSQTLEVNTKKLLDLVLELPDLQTLRFAGGEPFIMPEVEEFLYKLVEQGKTDLEIEFITNCTSAKTRILDTLEKFKHVELMCSIDAVGDALEYQRYPARWENIERNFIKMYNSKCTVSLTPCISMLTYHNMTDFFEWANRFPKARVSYNEVDEPTFLDFRLIPISARSEFYKTFNDIKFIDVNKNWKKFQQSIMYEHRVITTNERNLLKHYSEDIWNYRCNVKFLDAYPWAKELI
jgi:organic radical activating enzyme